QQNGRRRNGRRRNARLQNASLLRAFANLRAPSESLQNGQQPGRRTGLRQLDPRRDRRKQLPDVRQPRQPGPLPLSKKRRSSRRARSEVNYWRVATGGSKSSQSRPAAPAVTETFTRFSPSCSEIELTSIAVHLFVVSETVSGRVLILISIVEAPAWLSLRARTVNVRSWEDRALIV